MKNLNNLTYTFRDNNVRIEMVNNEPWFVAKDVCEVLDIKNSRDAVSRLDEDEKASVGISDGSQIRNMSVVNESGLYQLVFSSNKQEAKEFRKWVTAEVLPSIRKHGVYATEDVINKTLEDPDFMIDILTKLKEEKTRRVESEKTVAILTHVNKNYTATEVAKEIGFKSATAMNKRLNILGIQYYQNGTWILYSKYADKGYVDIKQDVLDNGKIIYHRKFTQIGREFVLKLIEKEGL